MSVFQMFNYCLAPDTRGDGTGCDNMTAVLVRLFKTESDSSDSQAEKEEIPTTLKREAEEADESPTKKYKI